MSGRRLDTVMRVRRIQEQLASAEVGRNRLALADAERAERAAWRLVADRAATAPTTTTRRDALLAERAKLAVGIAVAHRLGDSTAAAHHHVDLAIDDWRRAAQRLDGIERLSERLTAAERAEEERREIVELDDLVVMRWEGGAA